MKSKNRMLKIDKRFKFPLKNNVMKRLKLSEKPYINLVEIIH